MLCCVLSNVGNIAFIIDLRGLSKYFSFVFSQVDLLPKDDYQDAPESNDKILTENVCTYLKTNAQTIEYCNTEQLKRDSGTSKDIHEERKKVEELPANMPEQEKDRCVCTLPPGFNVRDYNPEKACNERMQARKEMFNAKWELMATPSREGKMASHLFLTSCIENTALICFSFFFFSK